MAANRHKKLLELEQKFTEAGDDLVDLLVLIGVYGVLSPGTTRPNDVQTAKDTLVQYIQREKKMIDDKRESLKKRSRDLIKNLQNLRQCQEKCGQFFDRAAKELAQMSMFTTCQLYRRCQDYKQQFQTRSENLKRGRLRFLTTGEICAGKSSLLSLLMGGAYLPVDHGPCTRIPCEIVHSQERKAYIFYKDSLCDSSELKLSVHENEPSWVRLRECIETGSDQDSGTKKTVEKVQIMWPILAFTGYNRQPADGDEMNDASEVINSRSTSQEDGPSDISGLPEISFIDVPGIVDKDETLESLIPFMKEVDAHIIVLNNADHQGIDKNRVVALMEKIQRICQQNHETFQPKLALFVCNKWDKVDDKNQPKLYNAIGKALRGIWPRISNDQLIPCVASEEAITSLRVGSVDDVYADFFIRMCDFIETAARAEIEVNSWWLASMLDRCISLNRRARDEKTIFQENKTLMSGQLRAFKENVFKFDHNRKRIDQEIHKKTEEMQKEAKQVIQQTLRENKEALCDWKDMTIPKYTAEETWEAIQTKLSTAIIERLEQHIMNENGIMKIKTKFDKFVKDHVISLISEYQYLIDSIPVIVDLADGMDEKFQTLNVNIYAQQETVILPYVLSALAVLMFPLAPIILLFWQIYDELNNSEFCFSEEKFFENQNKYMNDRTAHFIDNVLKNRLSTVADAAIQDATRNAKFTIYFLHNSTEVYLNSVESLMEYLKSNKDQTDSVEAIDLTSQELKQYVIENIVQDDISHDQLTYDLDDQNKKIAEGNCTTIHLGELIVSETKQTVVVKKIKQPLGDGNFPEDTFILRELYNFQMLSHKPPLEKVNFIEFFGFQTRTTQHEFRLFLVTEWCDFSIESIIRSEGLDLPGTRGKIKFAGKENGTGIARAYALDLSLQVAKGIRFLHRYNIVHRDIKPGNFVVKINNSSVCVKIIDLGISHADHLVSTRGPDIGTLCYNAPEVQQGGVHSTASDVYSACLVFWELWYGELIIQRARNNLKIPPPIERALPPTDLKNIMQNGWRPNGSARQNIMQIVAKLQTLCHNYKLQTETN